MSNKKKIGIAILMLGLLILIILAFTVHKEDDFLSDDPDTILENAQQESKEAEGKKLKEHKKINIETFYKYYEGKKTKLILFARPTCEYCSIAEPILKSLSYQYNIDINYINTEELTTANQEELLALDEFFKSLKTPTLMIVKDKNIVDFVKGLTDRAHYKDFLRKNKIIK